MSKYFELNDIFYEYNIQITKLSKTFIFFRIISLIHVLETILYLNNLYKYMFWHENRITLKQKLSQNQFFVNYIYKL